MQQTDHIVLLELYTSCIETIVDCVDWLKVYWATIKYNRKASHNHNIAIAIRIRRTTYGIYIIFDAIIYWWFINSKLNSISIKWTLLSSIFICAPLCLTTDKLSYFYYQLMFLIQNSIQFMNLIPMQNPYTDAYWTAWLIYVGYKCAHFKVKQKRNSSNWIVKM